MNLMDLVGRGAPPAIARLPGTPGVYRFRDARGRVLYIGRASALRSRVASYWSDLGGRAHLAPMVTRVARVEAVSCASAHEAAWLERNLLEHSMPPWNRTAGGQESVVHIRMDQRPSAPGLSVVYRTPPAAQVRYFGPYLGGLRVRQAVSGLHRILPLAYAGTGLRGGQRDMARARGVTGADRGELIRALAAVLECQPDAVAGARADLGLVRDRAAGSLVFEFAAQVQSEIQALDWVTSPQRVTAPEAGDADVYGWSGDVLVRFGVRGGRLCQWSARRCSRSRATPRLAATPTAWADFARRNAELAAALRLAD
jgi:excinuclease ABC subunit C